MRTSPIHYIAPSAISIVPNCNNSANDLAVTISRGTKIKVYSPRAGIGKTTDGEYQEWTLTGRNRRLANADAPYTIYARLPKDDVSGGYLVFSEKVNRDGIFIDKWSYITENGLAPVGYNPTTQTWGTNGIDNLNWYVRLGDVSLPDANNQRTVTLDTGILGTDQFNDEWALRPDELPLRIELGCTIGDEDAGPTPYVYWGQSLVLTAMLTEGWTGTDIQRFDRWEIIRNSGDAVSDMAWNRPDGEKRVMVDGQIVLIHNRNNDDFNGAVAVTFTILAVDHNDDTLRTATINIMAETVERYELSLSENIVSYDPQTQNYSPDGGVNVGIRATDQRGEVFDMTRGQIANAFLVAEYAPVGSTQWTALTFGGSSQEAATANIDTTAFALQQSVNVRLMRRITADGQTVAEKELSRTTIAFVRNGEDSKIREWIYRLNSNAGYNATTGTAGGTAVSGQTDGVDNCLLVDDFVPTGWSDDPTGVSQPGDVEWESWRDYDDENHRWGTFHAPVIHNRYAEDAVTYRLECNVESIRISANETSAAQNLRAKLYQRTGTAAEEEYSCYWAIYNRRGNTFRRVFATVSRRTSYSIDNYSVSSDSSSAEYADAVVLVCAQQSIDGNSYSSSLPAALIAKTEVTVIKDGDTGPKGDDAQEVNPNILLRTIFDRGIDFVLEAWTRTNELIAIDGATDTIVNGRKSLRMNASSQDLDFQQNVFGKVKPSTWYTLSFNYFATQSFHTFLWDASNTTPWIDLSEGYMIDGSATPTAVTRIDGFHEWEADWRGNRHSITFKTASTFATNTLYVLFRCLQGGQVAICMPKLEEGRVATAYMAHESDLKGDAGQNTVIYDIVFNEAWARIDNSGNITARLRGIAYIINGQTRTPLTGAYIRYGYILDDPDTYADTTTNSGTNNPGYFSADTWFDGDTAYFSKGSTNIFAAIIVGGEVMVVKYVTIARQGADGVSVRGKTGRFYYYAGVWKQQANYSIEETQAPYVKMGNSFYMLDNRGVEPATLPWSPSTAPGTEGDTAWTLMSSLHQYYIAQAFFGENAYLGSFIINGDWMLSQYGTLKDSAGNVTVVNASNVNTPFNSKVPYAWFDADDPMGDSVPSQGDYKFIPNFAVDGLTGKTYQNDAYIRGEVHATSGEFLGDNNGFELKLDADDRKLTIKGPIGVSDRASLTPTPGAIIVEYMSLGELSPNNTQQTINGQLYNFLTTALKMRSYFVEADGSDYIELTLNPMRGLTMKQEYGDGIVNNIEAVYGYTIAKLPYNVSFYAPYGLPSRDAASYGQVYLDGETLKVKLSS